MSKVNIESESGAVVYDRTNHYDLKKITFYIRPDRFRFSHSAIARINFKQGMRVVFINLEDWYMALSNGNDNGYLLQKDSNRSGVSISASVIARAVLKKIAPGKDRCECTLEETNYEYHGNKVYKIENRSIIK